MKEKIEWILCWIALCACGAFLGWCFASELIKY